MSATASNLFPSVKRLTNAVITHGKGSYLFNNAGQKLLDFTSGIGVCCTGHAHPTIVKHVFEQAGKMSHCQQSCAVSKPTLDLIDKMIPLMPTFPNSSGLPSKKLDSFFFSNSGSEAVEAAVRLARHATKKQNIVVFNGGYHGRTTQTLALTSSGVGYRGAGGYGPQVSGQFFVPYPYEHLGAHRSVPVCLAELDMLMLSNTAPSETAAILIEPVLGEGGYVPCPPEFLKALRVFCDKHEILLIFDEVQCGYGRTGTMFACEHSMVQPDILVLAKGLASGYPLSCIVTNSELSKKQSLGSMGGTYGGNPVAVAAAIGTLDVFKEEHILKNVVDRGNQMVTGLKKMADVGGVGSSGFCKIEDVRGLGLMLAIEFDPNHIGVAGKISKGCLDKDVMVMTTGVRQTLRFMPPLTVSEGEVNEFLGVFEGVVKEVGVSMN